VDIHELCIDNGAVIVERCQFGARTIVNTESGGARATAHDEDFRNAIAGDISRGKAGGTISKSEFDGCKVPVGAVVNPHGFRARHDHGYIRYRVTVEVRDDEIAHQGTDIDGRRMRQCSGAYGFEQTDGRGAVLVHENVVKAVTVDIVHFEIRRGG